MMGYETEISEVIGPSGKTFKIRENTSGNLVAEINGDYLTTGNPLAAYATDVSGNVTGLVGPDGGSAFFGSMTNGAWMKVPSLFRMRMTGTGTVTIDAKNALGTITSAFATYSPSGATNQIEYPYPGDDVVMIRATLTGTATAEII